MCEGGQNGTSGVVSPSVLKHFTYRGGFIKSLNSRGEIEPLAPIRQLNNHYHYHSHFQYLLLIYSEKVHLSFSLR